MKKQRLPEQYVQKKICEHIIHDINVNVCLTVQPHQIQHHTLSEHRSESCLQHFRVDYGETDRLQSCVPIYK